MSSHADRPGKNKSVLEERDRQIRDMDALGESAARVKGGKGARERTERARKQHRRELREGRAIEPARLVLVPGASGTPESRARGGAQGDAPKEGQSGGASRCVGELVPDQLPGSQQRRNCERRGPVKHGERGAPEAEPAKA